MLREARAFNYGLMTGVTMMYFFDPRQGAARRARVRDKSVKAVHDVEQALRIGSRDAAYRLRGIAAELSQPRSEVVPDDVLVQRVRSRLGRVCSHPHAIRVAAKGGGSIELKGPILRSDVDRVLGAVSRVRGVTDIDNDLEIHEGPDVSALQGAPLRSPNGVRLAPATKLAIGVGSAGVALLSLLTNHPLGLVLGGAGTLAIARNIKMRGSQHPMAAHA